MNAHIVAYFNNKLRKLNHYSTLYAIDFFYAREVSKLRENLRNKIGFYKHKCNPK